MRDEGGQAMGSEKVMCQGEERERAAADRLTQAASRMAVMEAQVRRGKRGGLLIILRDL